MVDVLMFAAPLSISRPCAVVLILLVLCCLAAPPTADAAAQGAGVMVASTTAVASIVDVMGNRTRMIQVTCVIVAIGVFVLTRSYR
jgi:hypothetical protein